VDNIAYKTTKSLHRPVPEKENTGVHIPHARSSMPNSFFSYIATSNNHRTATIDRRRRAVDAFNPPVGLIDPAAWLRITSYAYRDAL
jgi:hypothetical protein